MNVLMVYPQFPDTFWSFKHAIKFLDKKASTPPLGLLTIAAMLPKEWEIKLIDMNVADLEDSDILWADLVMISAMTVQRSSVNEVLNLCHRLNRKVAAGGPLFTTESENFPLVDYFILNEGEKTLPPFIHDLEAGTPAQYYRCTEYPDIQETPTPRYELLDMSAYDSMSIQYSRGCPFHCDFCNITSLFGHRPRVKSVKQILAELDRLYELGWSREVFFVDDNLIGNKKHIKEEVLPALIQWRKGKAGFNFVTEVSINLSDDKELMQLMADAGFISIFVGIETPSEEGLEECHKSQNTRRNLLDSVHTLQSYGMQVMAGFIVGFDSDKEDIFQRQFDFIQDSGIVTAMVGMLQAPLGTQLYDRLYKEGRIQLGFTGDNGDGETNIVPIMDIHTLKSGYVNLVRSLFSPKVAYQRIRTMLYHFKPQVRTVTISGPEIKALFRSFLWTGILSDARWEFWKLLVWTLFRFPAKLPLAITMTVYAYHFRKMSLEHVKDESRVSVGSQKPIRIQTSALPKVTWQ